MRRRRRGSPPLGSVGGWLVETSVVLLSGCGAALQRALPEGEAEHSTGWAVTSMSEVQDVGPMELLMGPEIVKAGHCTG
jgi:hypothetical protein